MNLDRLVAGLDIGSAKTTAIIAEVVGDLPRHPTLKILGVGQARTTGLRLPARASSAREIADIHRAARALGRAQSTLVVQPPPAAVALDEETVNRAVDQALQEARAGNISGAAVTPFLLAAVERATGGRSLAANLGLLEENAFLAGAIANELARGDQR